MIQITDAATRFDLPVSTLRYWERRGLIRAHRTPDGRRCYDTDQMYRIALVQIWRETGQLSLEQIAGLLAATTDKAERVAAARTEVVEQIRRLEVARDYLDHLATCRHPGPLETCPNFRTEFAPAVGL